MVMGPEVQEQMYLTSDNSESKRKYHSNGAAGPKAGIGTTLALQDLHAFYPPKLIRKLLCVCMQGA